MIIILFIIIIQKNMKKKLLILPIFLIILSCSNQSTPEKSYSKSDQFGKIITKNILETQSLKKELDVDHSRLANAAGVSLPPTKVFMFTNETLQKKLLEKNNLLALELPLRVLVYKKNEEDTKVIWSDIDYISNRYNMVFSSDIINEYKDSFNLATKTISPENLSYFRNRNKKNREAIIMSGPYDYETNFKESEEIIKNENNGIITLDSSYDYETTLKKSLEVIKSNSDVTVFDVIDFQSKVRDSGGNINKTTLIIFGAPNPGGKAMMKSQTLGLDAFPQKYLIWEDEKNKIHVSYNNLISIAEDQNVHKALALRIIQYRLNKSFEKAFKN